MSQESVQSVTSSQLAVALNSRFPKQGFSPAEEGDQIARMILTWGTVYDLAKDGKFEDIRPDVLVQHYQSIRLIHEDNCNIIYG